MVPKDEYPLEMQVEIAMRRSHRWEKRSLDEHLRLNSSQGLYGIIQGGIYEDLRSDSINFVNSLPFFGHGIGGSLGANHEDMSKILKLCNEKLSPDRPKHLLGIGKIADIELAVPYGIDTFDCVHPTRIARHGGALLYNNGAREHININNACHKEDYRPIDEKCRCYTCCNFTRSYLHYLFAAKEILGILLVVEHNVHFMNREMERIREKIRMTSE